MKILPCDIDNIDDTHYFVPNFSRWSNIIIKLSVLCVIIIDNKFGLYNKLKKNLMSRGKMRYRSEEIPPQRGSVLKRV